MPKFWVCRCCATRAMAILKILSTQVYFWWANLSCFESTVAFRETFFHNALIWITLAKGSRKTLRFRVYIEKVVRRESSLAKKYIYPVESKTPLIVLNFSFGFNTQIKIERYPVFKTLAWEFFLKRILLNLNVFFAKTIPLNYIEYNVYCFVVNWSKF